MADREKGLAASCYTRASRRMFRREAPISYSPHAKNAWQSPARGAAPLVLGQPSLIAQAERVVGIRGKRRNTAKPRPFVQPDSFLLVNTGFQAKEEHPPST